PLPAKKSATAEKLTPVQLRDRAAKAEKAGDWESAFTAYCQMPVADRSAPELREKVNAALRHVQQIRRHRDAGYVHFVSNLSTGDGVNLLAEVTAKVPGLFADPARATPQLLWSYGIVELERALAAPAFRQAFLTDPQTAKVEAFRKSLQAHWAKRTIA